MKTRTVVLCALAVCACLASSAFCAEDGADQAAYESFKESYGSFKGVYDKTKSTVDSTAGFFGKFNESVSTWRNACSKEFQEAGIEGITELTKEQLGAIDSLAESLSEATGISIPENIPEKIKDKISAKLLASIPQDKRRKFGYMYTLSSVDRQLRESGTYQRLMDVKEQFEAGSELLGKVDNVVEFMDTFNPKTDGSVTGSLKKIKGVLDYMGGFTEGVPLIGKIIKGYADVTEGFVGALEELDKKLKDCRQGSLGGQLGVDVEVKKKIVAEFPEVEAEMTLYFSINGDYPELKPIRGWHNEKILLYHGSDSGDGAVALMHAGSFSILYKYYVALKHSGIDGARKMVDPETFMGRARAIASKDISASDKQFRGYYAVFEGAGSSDFLNVLDAAGKRGDDSSLISESGRTMEYRLFTKKEDEFAALCFFSHQFRADVEGLIAKYKNMYAVDASVKAKDGRKLEGLEILLNGATPAKLAERNNRVSFKAVFKKDEKYSLGAKASGMKPYSKSGLSSSYMAVELEPAADTGAAFKIIAPDTAETGTPFSFSVDLGSTTLGPLDIVQCYVPGTVIVNGTSGSYTPSSPGTLKLSAQIIRRDDKGGMSYSPSVVKEIAVSQPSDYGIKITFDAPTDVAAGGERVNIKVTIEGQKPVYGSISYSLREENSGEVLMKPTSWGSQYKPGWKQTPSASFDIPKKPCTCVFVYEVPQRVSASTTTIIASARHTMTVHPLNLKVPSPLVALDIVQVSVSVPGPLSGKVKTFGWSPYDAIVSGSDWGRTTTASVKMQIRNDHILAGGTVNVACSLIGEKNEIIGTETQTVSVRPVKIGATVPGSWEGGFPEFKRKPALRMRPDNGKDVQSASVTGWVKVVMDRPTSVFYKEADARKSIESWASKNGAQAKKITIGNFEGSIAEVPVRSRYGGNPWGYVDVGNVQASASGKGLLFNGAFTLSIDYSVGGGGMTLGEGTPWWDDMAFVVQQTEQAQAEALGIIAGLKITPDAAMTKGPDEKPKAEPKVKLTASRQTLRKGETAEVTASVENAQEADKPFSYAWSGNFAGKGSSVTFLASQPGKQSVSVAVKGARYGLGSASVEFTVEDVSVKITKASPAGNSIVVGTEATFTAAATVAGKAPKEILYRWQPHPEVTFTPFEGAEGKTTARFTRTGKVKVWVDALEKKDGALSTLGSSDQIELDIVKPELKLALSPQSPLVGQEIKAEVSSAANLVDADFRWELSSNAQLVSESQDSKSIVFYAKDDKQVSITCRARVKQYGDELGEVKATVTAKPYKVKVDVLGPIGPAPMVWKPGQGLVEEKGAIATFQNVRIKVSIEPAPPKTPRFEWTINSGSHFAGGQTSNEITVNRSEKGECAASVEVSDANGLKLGKGSASFSVTVSQDDVKNSEKKKKAAEDLAKAKEMVPKGMMDEALTLLGEAAKNDPQNGEITQFSSKVSSDRNKIRGYIARSKEHLTASRLKEAQAEHGFASSINVKYPPVVEMKTVLDAAVKKAGEIAAPEKEPSKPETKADGKTGKGETTAKPALPGTPEAAAGAPPGLKTVTDTKKPLSVADDINYQAEVRVSLGDGFYQQYRTNSMNGGSAERSIDLLTSAAQKYEESIAIRDHAVARKKLENVKTLREGLVQALKNAAQAVDIRKEADKLAQKKKYRDAISRYQDAIKLHSFPDQAMLGATVFNLQVMAANEEADALRAEGEKLEKKGSLKEAVAKYDEALKAYHPTYPFRQNFEVHIQELRNIIIGAASFKKSGEAKEKKGQLPEAIADYEQSVKLLADKELKEHIDELKKKLAEMQKEGDRLKAQGEKLEAGGGLRESLEKYNGALAVYYPSSDARKELAAHVVALKASLAKADVLRKQGEQKEKKKLIAAAIADYEASLKIVKDEELEAHVKELKAASAVKPQAEAESHPATGGEAMVRQMYTDFAKAYESKNESRVMSCISSDWSAGDGTSVSDLRNYLHNSFMVFDEIRYTISNLQVRKIDGSTFSVSYDIAIIGRIFDNNIRHEEKSGVEEQVVVDPKGRVKILKTSAGKFWYVE